MVQVEGDDRDQQRENYPTTKQVQDSLPRTQAQPLEKRHSDPPALLLASAYRLRPNDCLYEKRSKRLVVRPRDHGPHSLHARLQLGGAPLEGFDYQCLAPPEREYPLHPMSLLGVLLQRRILRLKPLDHWLGLYINSGDSGGR